jgi:hypothetical protein
MKHLMELLNLSNSKIGKRKSDQWKSGFLKSAHFNFLDENGGGPKIVNKHFRYVWWHFCLNSSKKLLM